MPADTDTIPDMIVFNGIANAALQEEKVRVAVQQIAVKPQVGAVLFVEDAGSRLYTRLKQEAAERIGIGYRVYEFSVKDPVEKVLQKIIELNTDPVITGIIIQKPTRALWQSHLETEQGSEKKNGFSEWWSRLVSSIDEAKDVDGLHPQTLKMIEAGTWQEQGRVLPATCQAVIDILGGYCEISEKSRPENQSELDHLQCLKNKKIIILGKSDLLGKPLYYYLHNLGFNVDMFGSSELRERIEAGRALTDADVLISATGRAGLITETMIKEGVAVVDVGEPRADVEFESVSKKASFITPVPGGVGPMTVVCLMENALRLVRV